MIGILKNFIKKKDSTMSVRSNFEKEFEAEEYEMLVLMKSGGIGAAKIDDMLKPTVDFAASVDLRTNELSQEMGRMEWLIKDDENRKGWGYDFKKYGIYRVVIRKCIPKQLEPFQLQIVNNRYMLVKVLQENASNEKMEALRDYYMKPVTIQNELGEFVLDREFSWFEGSVDWNGEEAKVYLETDEKNGDSVVKAMETLQQLVKDLSVNDMRYRQFAAKELTSLANDWLQESDEEEQEEITEESFVQRMEISEVSISSDGAFTLYYHDDDMFWGHVIEVLVGPDGEMESADISG